MLKHPCDKRTHLVDTFTDRNRIVAIGTPILYSAACITSDSSVQRVRNFRRF